ncbi:glycosyltransferase [Vibrio cholerae]|nr:glycosyltransferase family 2 protein [Vibrio cholerae]EGR0628372.1 glycosyltransferase family 2 protein [Vibrio cholerae]MEB5560782.1 glycosyltransferase [Vibrio cholerae]MEB5621454.1 glycosyltransferase [Vibrio cholerae]
MNDGVVTIITPAYNCVNSIFDTARSIKNQTYSNWEWLITDDCSSDNTFEVLNSLSDLDSRIKVLRNNINSGAAVSRNKAIEKASGEYIAFIDSDDLWSDNKLKLQLEFMQETGCDFSFTSYSLIDERGNSLDKIVDKEQLSPLNYQDMLKKKATLGCSTVMLRRSAFSDISMPLLRTGQDYALWLKLLKSGKLAYHLNIPLTKYRILPNSISRNKFKKAKRQWQIYRELENLSLSKASICFLFYAWRAVFRK